MIFTPGGQNPVPIIKVPSMILGVTLSPRSSEFRDLGYRFQIHGSLGGSGDLISTVI